MEFRKLRQLDSESGGVTLPKQHLRDADLLDNHGQIKGGAYVMVERLDDGEWHIETVDQ